MIRDILITARVPNDDEDTVLIASGVQLTETAEAYAAEVLLDDFTEEEKEHYRKAYSTDNGIHVISYSCAPTGTLQHGAELTVTWGLIGRLLRAVVYYTGCLLFRRAG